MGYEIVKGKDGFLYVWNTRIDVFEFKFKNTVQLIDFIEGKHGDKLTEDQKNDWEQACEKPQDIDAFFRGMIVISVEDIKKYGEKVLS